MTVTIKALIKPKQAEATQTTQYEAVNCKTAIDKFTVTNTGLVNTTFSVNLVPTPDPVGASNLVLKSRAIAPGEAYTCPELVGQVLESGGVISTLAGSAVVLTISASGREIT
jgi:hypothetical protein